MSSDFILGAFLFILVPLPILAGYLMRNGPNAETGIFLLGGGLLTGAVVAGFLSIVFIPPLRSLPWTLDVIKGLAFLILLACPVLWIIDRIKKSHSFTRIIFFLAGGGLEILFLWEILRSID
jgi:hypothetical protein